MSCAINAETPGTLYQPIVRVTLAQEVYSLNNNNTSPHTRAHDASFQLNGFETPLGIV